MTQDTHSKRYSEAFKRQVVQEYEAGSSLNHLRRKYGIGGSMTIQKWVRRYSHRGLQERSASSPEPLVSPAAADQTADEMRRLEERIRWLEKAVSELTIDKLLLQSTLAAYQELYGDELVKKTGRPSSNGPTSRLKGRSP